VRVRGSRGTGRVVEKKYIFEGLKRAIERKREETCAYGSRKEGDIRNDNVEQKDTMPRS